MNMNIEEHAVFYLNGKRPVAGLDSVKKLGLRPALLAHYRDLDELRYDYPLVLVDQVMEGLSVISLTSLFDVLLEKVTEDDNADRLRHLARRLESEIRKRVTSGAKDRLLSLWDQAERQLEDQDETLNCDDLVSIRSALEIDGDVVDCDRELPQRMLVHGWLNVQAHKARQMRAKIDRLILKLSDILQVDEANAETSLNANKLEISFGKTFASDFDFGAMSGLLTTTKAKISLPDARRERIQRLFTTLESQRFIPTEEGTATGGGTTDTYEFVFHRCGEALKAYRERLPQMVELAKAMLMAELEVDGTYHEDLHDNMFETLELDPAALEQFPNYLVCLNAPLKASENAKLIEALSAGLPLKILLQTDDIAAPEKTDVGLQTIGVSVRRFSNMAVGIGGVYILQSTNSHLYRFRDNVLRGLSYSGPALFSVYSGIGSSKRDLPPYLMAAAAMESRAFPAFVYDPGAGSDWASRCFVGDNPQAERNWPVHAVNYEDESLQRFSADVAFTLVDFLALDKRHATHLARVRKAQWSEKMIPVANFIETEQPETSDKVPYLLMVDLANDLHRVLVSHQLIREALRCQEQWHTLRELGGVCNSFAKRLLASERQAWEEKLAQQEAEAQAAEAGSQVASPAPEAVSTEAASEEKTAPGESVITRDPDEAYIETSRCSTCNECTEINNRMFKYNELKQAYIADLTAGTYAEMVLAAERCQLAIIHPGKPLNSDEPDLEELLKRAEPFL